MKVIKTTTDNSETSVEIDLFEGRKLPAALKKKIATEVGEFLVEQTLVSMNEKKSPVQGEGGFKALSKDYKKKKLSEVGSGEANLEFDGIMKDELDFEITKSGVAIGVFGERAGAADGHNNLSGKSQLPKRRFLPDTSQNYKQNIQREVDRIIADNIADNMTFDENDFKNIKSKREMYDTLAEVFGFMTRSELALAVFRNEELTNIFKKHDLMGFL